MQKSYSLVIDGKEYMVGARKDVKFSPPSAGGFVFYVMEKGLGKYEPLYEANEDNGYAFLIYKDDSNELILKGSKGEEHQKIFEKNAQLKTIKEEKFKDTNIVDFLRVICLSGRTWPIQLGGKNYYFCSIWNLHITSEQNTALSSYLSKFPKERTFIQMGQLSEHLPSSKLSNVASFKPVIRDSKTSSPVSKKEKQFLSQLHQKNIGANLPPEWKKKFDTLKEVNEHIKNVKLSNSMH